jgi:uncharacterized protein (TIGR03546 family)
MFVQWIAKFLVAVNSNTRPVQIGLGVAFAFLLGAIPFVLPAAPPVNLLWLVIFLIAFFLKVNQAIQAIFILIFKCLTPLMYPFTAWLGETILTLPALRGLFTSLNNLPLVPFTFFNSTIVMGGLILGLVMFAPLAAGSMLLLKLYREKVREKIAGSRFVKGFLKIPVVDKLRGIFGGAVSFYQNIRG